MSRPPGETCPTFVPGQRGHILRKEIYSFREGTVSPLETLITIDISGDVVVSDLESGIGYACKRCFSSGGKLVRLGLSL